ncbi:MAG: hypothetical protein ACLU99_10290 [Alphaproteobacteria bacterium]
MKNAGFWTIGMDGYAQNTVAEMNKSGKTAIIMGSKAKVCAAWLKNHVTQPSNCL